MGENETKNPDGQEKIIADNATPLRGDPEISDDEIIINETEQALPDEGEQAPTETGETSEDLTPKGEEEGDVKVNQEAINKKINKFVREKKEAEELAEAEKVKRRDFERQLQELKKVDLPPVPAVPEYLDPEYTAKIAARDNLIMQHATEAARKETLAQLEQSKIDEANNAAQAEVAKMVENFDKKAEELKLDKAELNANQNIVGNYIPAKPILARRLLAEADGPLIVNYLANNLVELDKVSRMNEADASVYVVQTIAPKAQQLKPKQTTTPDPPYTVDGRGAATEEDPNLEGCKFF